MPDKASAINSFRKPWKLTATSIEYENRKINIYIFSLLGENFLDHKKFRRTVCRTVVQE